MGGRKHQEAPLTRKQIFGLLWIVFTTLPLAAEAREIPTINVGVIVPQSGSQKPFGDEFYRGIELAIDFFESQNPTLKNKVRVLRSDDSAQAKKAAEAAEELITKQRAHVLLGAITSNTSDAILKVAERYKKPFVSPIVTTSGSQKSDYLFQIGLNNRSQGIALAQFATGEMKARKAAILWDGTRSNAPLVEAFEQQFSARGGKVVTKVTYPLGTTDYKSQLKELRRRGPEFVLLPAYYNTAAAIMEQAKSMGWLVKFLGSDGWDSPRLLQAAGKNANGHYFLSHFAPSRNQPIVLKFVGAFQEKYGRSPGAIAALAFDGMNLVLDAFARGKTVLPKPFLRAFQGTENLEGVTGILSLTAGSAMVKSGMIMEVTGGAIKHRSDIRL